MSICDNFGQQLYLVRKARGLSQEKMAELCQLSSRHYHDLELGRVNPSLETAGRLSSTFGFSIDDLVDKNEA